MKFKAIIAAVMAAVLAFFAVGCGDTEAPTPAPVDQNIESMKDVHYLGWNQIISDDTYLYSQYRYVSPDKTIQAGLGKYNFKTGVATPVCVDELCDHSAIKKCIRSAIILFSHGNKLYYNENTEEYDAIVSYDITTGEYDVLLKYSFAEAAKLYLPVLDGDDMYYLKQIAAVDNPVTEADYKLSLCKMNLNSKKEEVLFNTDKVPQIAEASSFPFVAGQRAYFLSHDTGVLYSVSLDGSDVIQLIDDKLGAIYSEYGVFLYDGYIYFLVNSNVYDKKEETLTADRYICRIPASGGEIERLSEQKVQWLFVTNQHIYYLYYVDDGTVVPEDTAPFVVLDSKIAKMSHSGGEAEAFAAVGKGTFIGDVYCTNGYLFMLSGGLTGSADFLKINITNGASEVMNHAPEE